MLAKCSRFGTAASSSCLGASCRQLGFVPGELEERKGHEARAHGPRCPVERGEEHGQEGTSRRGLGLQAESWLWALTQSLVGEVEDGDKRA